MDANKSLSSEVIPPENLEEVLRRPSSNAASTVVDASGGDKSPSSSKKGYAFWMVFVSICISSLLSAIELTSVGTALPTIVSDLHGNDFVWAGSAYTLAGTAFLPMFGGLAQIWGRRATMVGALIAFMAGSAICGAAQNMNMLIAGRTLQGVGSGGILSLTEIIISDLVPLKDRGPYLGIVGVVWSFSSAMGPPVGGALADRGQWRWLFYINLPIGGVALFFVFFFLKFRVPNTNTKEKLAQMDWIGNFIVVASTASCTIALAWAGVTHPWSSAQVLVPLVLGLVGFAAFLYYEARFAKFPVLPIDLLSNRTSLSGYLTTFIHGVVSIALIYYLPVYFQAAKSVSAIRSAVLIFGAAFTIAPGGIVSGVSVQISGRYSPQNYIGWILTIIGFGILTTLHVDTSIALLEGIQVILGIGVGFLFTATTYPILAGIKIERTAHALAVFTFVRSFAQTWGITIGGTILQNELSKRLPPSFLSTLESGVSLAYAAIPQIPSITDPAVKAEVQVAFAQSMSIVWKVMLGLSGGGLLSALLMKELKMHDVTDEAWGFEEKKRKEDEEIIRNAEKELPTAT